MPIYLHQIEDLIEKLEEAGQKVTQETHAIYASSQVEFDEDVYPLDIITSYELPEKTVVIVSRKIEAKNE